MRKELDDTLCAKYPKIFADRHADIRTTCMCWGFDIGDGWYDIVDELCSKIQNICDRTGHQIKAVQVKEKFGTLRFYTDYSTDEIWDAIAAAEHKSAVTCETCGQPGKIRGHGWFYTACDKHTHKDDLGE